MPRLITIHVREKVDNKAKAWGHLKQQLDRILGDTRSNGLCQ